jgi:Phosphate-selective porin O and P
VLKVLSVLVLLLGAPAVPAFGQVTPAAGYTPPDDTPAIRVGATIFANYTYQQDPPITDADGNLVNKSAFDVARSYVNITGNVSHVVAFRVTPDISRETNAASSLAGSLVFRIKYAYLQTNFDDWMSRGSFARFGIQQTPYLDSLESIYRYRFQGTLFVERSGYFASADAGASFRYNLPSNYGDVHVGVYNGENYNKAEPNDQKALMVRATVRPFATGMPIMRGIKATVFYDADHYVKGDPRMRFITNLTFEHAHVNAAFEFIKAKDQTVATAAEVESQGFSIWATPKQSAGGVGWEGLLRYDHHVPNTATTAAQNRVIAGIAYWFPHPGGAPTTALMLDYDGQMFKNITTKPTKSIVVHALINF